MATTYKQVRRFDLGQMGAATRTPQGFLKVPGYATRVGVFPYMDGDGKVRRELRHPDDVFDAKSMESLKYAPVTIEHPPEMITPSNVAQYSVGHTTERVEKQADKLDTDLIIEQEKGIDAVEKDGVRELSCGYTADIVEESGDWNGAPYDFRQTNILYNHLAMVKRGRAGPEIRMRLDSKDAVMQESIPPRGEFSQESAMDEETNAVGEPSTKRIVLNGQELELPSDAADTIQDYMDRFDEMRAKLSELEEEMKARRNDKNDADIDQKGISPQVKVEQQGPDGRGAGGKTPARPGTITGGPSAKSDKEKDEHDDEDEHGIIGGMKANSRGKGGAELADEESEEDCHDADAGGSGMAPSGLSNDAEEKEKEKGDFEAAPSAQGGGAAMSSVDRLKKDLDGIEAAYGKKMDSGMRRKFDHFRAKFDNFAAESFGKDEKHADRGDSASQKAVRERVKLERLAEKLVPSQIVAKFDSMSDDQVRATVIKHRHPKADLSGKSSDYLQMRFDTLCEDFEYVDEDARSLRRDAGRRMLGLDRNDAEGEEHQDSEIDPNQARLKMIKTSRDEYKSNLSATKK